MDTLDFITTPVHFDEISGLAKIHAPLERRYSDMKNIYLDEKNRATREKNGNGIIYRYYDFHVPKTSGNLAFGTSIVYPGKVGNEYHMTHGHFHSILDTSEIYYCRAGRGIIMMENPEGKVLHKEIKKGEVVYVPGRYAHRSINTSLTETLITFYVFRADAGHDYRSIKEKGFRNIVVDDHGSWHIIPNPQWEVTIE